ncbi:MAG: cytochrome P450 [Anaerolineae bacterium]
MVSSAPTASPGSSRPSQLESLPKVSLLPGILRQPPFYLLADIAREHGGFVRLTIGPKSVYLVSDPLIFQHVLRDNVQNYRKSRFLYSAAKPMVGEGLLTSEGDYWLRQRRLVQPQFHHTRIAAMAQMMTEIAADRMAAWAREDQPGTRADMGERMAQITVEVVSHTLFGTATLSPTEIDELGGDMVDAANYVALRGYMPFIPRSIPLPGHGRFSRAIHNLTGAVNTIIEAGTKGEVKDDNLITMLLNAVDDETHEHMTHQQLFYEVMTLFAAGFETTATALTWIWKLLGENPQVEQTLREEIARVIGDRVPTFEDLPKLTYCRQVFQECLRYYPPIPLLPRTTLADDEINGYKIPKGTILLMFFYGLHHNADYWESPDSFDPTRFTPSAVESRHRFAYLPFSAGPRQCIGNEFAMTEGMLVLAMMLQRYRVTLADDAVTPNLSATLKPNPGVYATLTPIR